MVRQQSLLWLVLSLLVAGAAACGGKAHSSKGPGSGIILPGAGGSGGDDSTEPTMQGGAGGAPAAMGASGSGTGGAAGSSAGGSAGTGSGVTLPTPSPCVFDADVEGGLQRCSNGLLHRPVAVTCPSLLPLPDPVPISVNYPADAGYPFECRRDSDCSEQPYGHCSTEPSFVPHCEYGCIVDSDCPQNQLCSCQSYGGRCTPGNCRTDGDCGQRLCGSDTLCLNTQFACQTALDQCAVDSDCPAGQRCTVGPSDASNPNSFLRRVCRERGPCTVSAGAP